MPDANDPPANQPDFGRTFWRSAPDVAQVLPQLSPSLIDDATFRLLADNIPMRSAGKSFGLDISLAFDHEGSLEVAEVIRCEPREVLYSLEPSNSNTVTLAGAYAGRCEFDSVDVALGRVLELDGDAD